MAFSHVSGLVDYWPETDAYSILRLLEGYRQVPDNPGGNPEYQTRAMIVDSDGNRYAFQHSHHSSLQNGRTLPQSRADCPRPLAEISPLTRECLDVCRQDADCALGMECQVSSSDGVSRCHPKVCYSQGDCDGLECVPSKMRGVNICQPQTCDAAFERDPRFGTDAERNGGGCVSTSHYLLKGREGYPKFDERYDFMY